MAQRPFRRRDHTATVQKLARELTPPRKLTRSEAHRIVTKIRLAIASVLADTAARSARVDTLR